MRMNQQITFVPTEANSKKTAEMLHHFTRGKKIALQFCIQKESAT